MSSSNSPYKSRLFNWLNRQYIRWSDRLGKNLRHFQVAAKWGVQLLLYPVYFLVQTGRMAERQIGKKVKQPRKLSSANQKLIEKPNQDIEQVLQVVKPLVAEVVNANLNTNELENTDLNHLAISAALTSSNLVSTNHNQKLIIRGIATLLDTKSLVIVTQENKVLDIFSFEEQNKIKSIIKIGLDTKKIEKLASKPLRYLPRIKANNPNLLPPVRSFWQVMGWIQNSAIARKFNVFGESELALTYSSDTSLSVPPSVSISGSTFNSYILDIQSIIAAAIEYFFSQRRNGLRSNINSQLISQISKKNNPNLLPEAIKLRLENNLNLLNRKIHNSLPVESKINKPKNEPNPFQMGAIIQAAIEYFFGDSLNTVVSSYEADKLSPSSEAGEWLSLEDVFLENQVNKAPKNITNFKPVNSQEKTQNIELNLRGNYSKKKKKKSGKKPQKELVISQTINKTQPEISPRENLPKIVREEQITFTPITPIEEENDILETQATTVGYEKHFLERILGWLDQILLWFEDLLLKIWRWLKSF